VFETKTASAAPALSAKAYEALLATPESKQLDDDAKTFALAGAWHEGASLKAQTITVRGKKYLYASLVVAGLCGEFGGSVQALYRVQPGSTLELVSTFNSGAEQESLLGIQETEDGTITLLFDETWVSLDRSEKHEHIVIDNHVPFFGCGC
jgi:hypothetical protein